MPLAKFQVLVMRLLSLPKGKVKGVLAQDQDDTGIVEPQVPGLAPLAVALPVKRDPVVDVAWLAEKVFSRSVELVFTATV